MWCKQKNIDGGSFWLVSEQNHDTLRRFHVQWNIPNNQMGKKNVLKVLIAAKIIGYTLQWREGRWCCQTKIERVLGKKTQREKKRGNDSTLPIRWHVGECILEHCPIFCTELCHHSWCCNCTVQWQKGLHRCHLTWQPAFIIPQHHCIVINTSLFLIFIIINTLNLNPESWTINPWILNPKAWILNPISAHHVIAIERSWPYLYALHKINQLHVAKYSIAQP